MSQAGRGLTSWTSMNENLMALLEAVLTLAASDASANTFHPTRASSIKPGGYSEDIFLNLTEDEQEELSCGICYQVLKEAMQCPNRHKFCHSCLVVWSTTGQYANRVRCPVCRCQGYYLHDHELDTRIDKKRVKCNAENCRWTGTLKYYGVHSNTHTSSACPTTGQAASQAQREEESEMDEDEEDDDEDEEDGNILELPYLGRATPHLPHRSLSRFNGTGLQARSMLTTAGAAAASVSRENRGGADPTVQITTTSLLDRSPGGGTALQRRPRQANANATAAAAENPVLLRERRNASNTAAAESSSSMVGGGGGILLRERRNANTLNANADSSPSSSPSVNREARTHSAHHRALRRGSNANNAEASASDAAAPASTARPSVRQRVHPIRRANRITVSHTNNNSSNASNNTTTTATTNNNVLYSTESGGPTTPRQPRPPSAPRPPNQAYRRNLPVLPAASGAHTRGHQSNSPSPTHIIRAPPTFNSTTASRGVSTNPNPNNGDNFQDQLRESRERLEGLMSSFSGELERSRQEMADFQVERERQRREQLTEVRELGRRLGQVASELRQLLNQRPRLRPDSDD